MKSRIFNFLYSVEGERKAIYYMIVGGFCFATMGALTFDLGKKVDWVFIAFCRMLFSFILVFFLASKSGKTPLLFNRKLLWLRSFTGTIAMLATFYSFTHLPVSDVSAITETRPVWVAILAVIILGERLRKALLPVTVLSIIGVLLIEKPHFDQRNFAVFVTLIASVQIIKKMWSEEKPNFKGNYYTIKDAFCNPKPVQQPHPAIQIGGSGEKYLLRVVAEHADEWNCPATSAEQFDVKYKALENHCKDIGRDINEIGLSQQTVCIIAGSEKELEDKLSLGKKRYGFFGNIESFGIIGTPENCIRKINENYKKGITKYTIFFSDGMNHDTLNFFAKEIIPEFQD